MAEADAFILAALQQSGWLEASEQTSSWTVTELSSDALIGVVLRFLKQLQDADDSATFTLPSAGVKAPVGVAARHRVGSQLANILKELGYAGDCGYNHFLYPSEKETRNILSWLVGKLPRSKLEGNEEDGDKSEVLVAGVDTAGWQDSVLESKQLADIFSSWKREKTLDSVKVTSLLEALAAEKRGATILLREDEFDEEVDMGEVEIQGELKAATSAGEGGFLAPQETEAEGDEFAAIQSQSFVAGGLPDVPLSLDSSSSGAGVAPEEGSLVESGGSSSLDSKKAVGDMSVIQGQEQKEKSEQSLEEVQKQVDDTEHRIAAMRKVLDRERGELQAVEQHVRQTQTTGQDIQKQVARQKQLMAMLPQAQANIAKLEAICQTNAEKKAEIVQQMEIARGPLLKEYTELEGQKSSRKARCRQLIHEIKTFRTEMLEITGIIHSKMESVGALEKIQERQLAKLGKKKHPDGGPMTRNMYTSRIMDIIKQVHKQKQDIAKILEDIKGLQKQLNISAEKLKRTEAVADEKIYSAASKSKSSSSTKAEAYVDCYRKFAQVRELFEDLILVIGDVGKKENAARDLHNWISQLEARDSRSNLDKVLADLESVRQENGTLQNELHARIA
uniref:Coiled-coil domain-containing protein 22 homolog n=1 Tax=Phytophthora ramorum TaxID=164328 RepID=H3GRX3_PHYRM